MTGATTILRAARRRGTKPPHCSPIDRPVRSERSAQPLPYGRGSVQKQLCSEAALFRSSSVRMAYLKCELRFWEESQEKEQAASQPRIPARDRCPEPVDGPCPNFVYLTRVPLAACPPVASVCWPDGLLESPLADKPPVAPISPVPHPFVSGTCSPAPSACLILRPGP